MLRSQRENEIAFVSHHFSFAFEQAHKIYLQTLHIEDDYVLLSLSYLIFVWVYVEWGVVRFFWSTSLSHSLYRHFFFNLTKVRMTCPMWISIQFVWKQLVIFFLATLYLYGRVFASISLSFHLCCFVFPFNFIIQYVTKSFRWTKQ